AGAVPALAEGREGRPGDPGRRPGRTTADAADVVIRRDGDAGDAGDVASAAGVGLEREPAPEGAVWRRGAVAESGRRPAPARHLSVERVWTDGDDGVVVGVACGAGRGCHLDRTSDCEYPDVGLGCPAPTDAGGGAGGAVHRRCGCGGGRLGGPGLSAGEVLSRPVSRGACGLT